MPDFEHHQYHDDLDLSVISDLHEFLSETPFACSGIDRLAGGFTNFTFRLRLKQPYEGHSTLVLKHAKGYVMSSGNQVPFACSRRTFEVEALHRVGAILSPQAIVTVPRVHLFDQAAHVIIMNDCGEGTSTLEKLIQDGKLSESLAKQIGHAIGDFLGSLHVWGEEDQQAASFFGGNQESKMVSASLTYGRLITSLNGEERHEDVCMPPTDISESEMKVIARLAAETTEAMISADNIFVMGDFWPGNIMVGLENGCNLTRIYVLDWESAKSGLPAMDVGQFCAKIDLLHRFQRECEKTASTIITFFLQAYSRVCRPDLPFLRTAIVHWGAHLVAWIPPQEWDKVDKVKETVEEGVRLLVEGYGGNESWMKGSYVGKLKEFDP